MYVVRGRQFERIIKFEKAKQCFENLSIEVIETSMKSIKLPPRMYFQVQSPPPVWISRAGNPPSREIFQHAFRRGGVDFFWNNPMSVTYRSIFRPTIGQPQLADISTDTRPTNITDMWVNISDNAWVTFRSRYCNRPICRQRGAQIRQDPEIVSQSINQCTQIQESKQNLALYTYYLTMWHSLFEADCIATPSAHCYSILVSRQVLRSVSSSVSKPVCQSVNESLSRSISHSLRMSASQLYSVSQ